MPTSVELQQSAVTSPDDARIKGERQSQRLVTAFILSGLIFMLLPGTFLGVWNLLGISQAHRPESIPPAWLQAHGQAQIFGWVGSFIIGIGFYSLTKMRSTRSFPARVAWASWSLWTAGVLLRWLGGVTPNAWHNTWRVMFPLSAVLQLAGYLAFYFSVRRHRPAVVPTSSRAAKPEAKPEAWMRLVAFATLAFLAALAINAWMLFAQALRGVSPALPHVSDQQFVVLAVWGILVPTIWGFNARWLPVFLGLKSPNAKALYIAYALSVAGIVATWLDFLPLAGVFFLLAALLAIEALHIWTAAVNEPKLLNVHHCFPLFVRSAYAWLLVSCTLALVAARIDTQGGFWGASRHAITVGFVAVMVFAIGQRILPAFCGMRVLWSKGLMYWSLYLLSAGCLVRVVSEPLAYNGIWQPAWHLLPLSAVVELTAVTLFAVNLGATLLQPPAHLRQR